MISIYAFSVFLWVCLCMQAPAQGTLVELKKFKRTHNQTHFKLTAEFVTDGSSVEARWFKYGNGIKELLEVSTPQNGETTYAVEKAFNYHHSLYLELGDPKSHYFQVRWNLNDDVDRELSVDLPMVTVSPGTDLAFHPRKENHIYIKVKKERGKNIDFVDHEVRIHSTYLKGMDVIIDEKPPFLKRSVEDQGGLVVTTLTFTEEREVGAINGYFIGYLEGVVPENSPFDQLEEYIVLKVHQATNKGPFPDDFVGGRFNDRACKEAWEDHTQCTLYCTVYANDLDEVNIYKVTDGKEEKQTETMVHIVSAFSSMAVLDLDAFSTTTPGFYVCRATSKNGYHWNKKIFVKPDLVES